MITATRGALRAALTMTCALSALSIYSTARAQEPAASSNSNGVSEVVVTATKTTRSAVVISGQEIQKLLPGISPLKAIQTLPGVVFLTSDPWGNNEQNESLFVHGFNTQQLGYTLDGVPLGDQQYGNYNGLSVSRALISENTSRVVLESGAGSLGVASTSNLGGAIETFSADPSKAFGARVDETVGSYGTNRTFLRLESGESDFGEAYVSYLHQDQRAWDFNGHQRGDQANLKYVKQGERGRFTAFVDWQSKVEPNEDADGVGNQAGGSYVPYTRPFVYPNLGQYEQYLQSNPNPNKSGSEPAQLPGTPPIGLGNNFSNYFSAAQRTDILTYAKYDYEFNNNLKLSNQVYYHYDYGRGIVAGPANTAGLPGLFAIYYPQDVVNGLTSDGQTLQNIVNVLGGTGIAVRTTEYRINREGLLSNLNYQFGQNQFEAGLWYEHNESATHRVWYPFSAQNDDLTPYSVPDGPKAFTQYYIQMFTDVVQLHLQDQWRIQPTLLLQAGWKASLQTARSSVPIQQQNLLAGNAYGLPATATPVNYPTGSITSNDWFLPSFGAVWDANDHAQVFANVQRNMRQYIPYGAGSNFYGASPWSLGSQAAFNQFKSTAHPESSWTYEVGVRSSRPIDLGEGVTLEGQASLYHVDFSNRLLNVNVYNFINPNPAVLVNVGGVTTNGVDLAGTLNLSEHVHLYNALSYNKSTYDSNYQSGQPLTTFHTAGKWVPLTPDWLNKTILSFNYGGFEAQINGDYIGRRYVTYLNDLSVPGAYQVGLEASYLIQVPEGLWARSVKLSANVTNITSTKGASTVNVTSTSGGYTYYPIAPPEAFFTLQANF